MQAPPPMLYPEVVLLQTFEPPCQLPFRIFKHLYLPITNPCYNEPFMACLLYTSIKFVILTFSEYKSVKNVGLYKHSPELSHKSFCRKQTCHNIEMSERETHVQQICYCLQTQLEPVVTYLACLLYTSIYSDNINISSPVSITCYYRIVIINY